MSALLDLVYLGILQYRFATVTCVPCATTSHHCNFTQKTATGREKVNYMKEALLTVKLVEQQALVSRKSHLNSIQHVNQDLNRVNSNTNHNARR